MSDDLPEIDELEPCPLCGGVNRSTSIYTHRNTEGMATYIATIYHSCRKECVLVVDGRSAIEQTAIARAIKAWNSLSKETP